MLRKILIWVGSILGVLLIVALGSYFFIAHNITNRTEKPYSFPTETLAITADSTTLKRGNHLVVIKGCVDCHGANMAGKVMMDDAPLGRLVATNLTKGKGGLPADYSTSDWLMAMRHGVDRNGRPLLLMPAHETTLLTQPDLTAIIAYCQQLAPVDNVLPENKLGPVVNVMTYFDKMPLLSVEKIDHTHSVVASVDTAEGVALGKYLAISCSGCHRPNFKGGDPLAPGLPPVPNITSTGNVGKWSQEQFIQTLRTGKTPNGHQMSPDDMPWKMTAEYEQKELASLYQFLHSVK